MSEKLSALIDNELDELERARLLRELSRDEDLAEQWSRYHMIGLAMRREHIASRTEGLPARVARALEEEPAIAGESAGPARSERRFRGPARFAIAATVAGVLLAGGLLITLFDGTGPGTSAQRVAVDADALQWQGADARSEDALNALLIEHGEFTSASGMNGLTAYTKFVAYDSR